MMSRMVRGPIVLMALLALTKKAASASYRMEGVYPQSYSEGEQIKLKVNKITSTRTLFPRDYYYLPFCHPEVGIKRDSENLGEILSGDRIENSPYVLQMKVDMYCEQLCFTNLGRGDKKGLMPNKVVIAVRKNYHNNWIVDNLPAASKMETDDKITTRYWQGFPVGFVGDDMKAYIHNHVNIEIMYHELEAEPGKYRVVRFMVQPFSIGHEFDPISAGGNNDVWADHILPRKAVIVNPIESCNPNRGMKTHTNYDMIVGAGHRPQLASGAVLFTYDVIWIENRELHWASRWDIYLTMDHAVPARVHYLPVVNSCVVAACLMVLIVLIRLRNLRHDELDEFNDLSSNEEEVRAQELEEKGWKLIYQEAFAPPEFPLFWSVCCGAGAQLLCTALLIIFFATLGFMSAAQRGHLVQNALLTFVAMGVVNGYVSARFYKMLGGEGSPTQMAALFFPGLTFVVFLLMNVLALMVTSTYAVPFITFVILVVLWLGCSAPLVALGARLGNWQEAIRLPKQPSSILVGILTRRYLRRRSSRTLLCLVLVGLLFNVFTVACLLLWAGRRYLVKRNLWSPKWSGAFMLLMGGLLSFGALFVELYYILASAWMGYHYWSYGFLFSVVLIVSVTCAEVAVIFGYIQLSMDGYFSWWWQFSYAGAVSIWVFFYSISYYQQLESPYLFTLLFFLFFMAWVSLGLFLMMGFVGVVVSVLFVRIIFLIARTGSRQSHDQVGDYIAVELAAGDEQAVVTENSHHDDTFTDKHEDAQEERGELQAATPGNDDSLQPNAEQQLLEDPSEGTGEEFRYLAS